MSALIPFRIAVRFITASYACIVFLAMISAPSSHAAIPTIVALWHGDGNAQDAVGSNHGTLMGGAGFAPGVVGQGFLLDGVNDYVRVPDSAALHFANELSFEMWFKRTDASSYGALIDKRDWTLCNYGLVMSPDWGFQLYYNAGSGFQISFSPVPSAGVFHHLVGTFRQADPGHVELKTYVDGQLARTDTLPGNLANTFNGTALAIGTARDGADGFFRGVIDEVALYNYALSPSQVLSNFNSVTPPPPTPPEPPATNSAPHLVSLWHGDGNAQDAVGSNHGTLMGGAGFAPGVVGQGFLLDGVNDYVRVPDSAALHFANELSFEMWFEREDASSYGALIDKRDLQNCNFGAVMSPDWGFQLYYNDPAINDGNSYEISFSSVPAPGVFHHFVGVYRQADSGHVEAKTYIDGQLVRSDLLRGNLANTFNGTALAIGTARDGADGFFRGVIDEVALYNYALSPSQVLSNYQSITPQPPTPPVVVTNSTGSLVALWHGENNAQDSAGLNHGTLMGGVGFAPGVIGQGFLLDGANDYIRVPDSASLHLSGELTLEMWFKREDSSSFGSLIDKRDWTSCNFGAIMSSDWGLQLYYNDPAVNDGNSFEISFSAVPSPGVFHHFAGAFRQVSAGMVELKTYIDGQLVRTDTLGGNLASTFNGGALAIGSARDGADGFFRGIIDEVAIYNYALSPAQVLLNYASLAVSTPQIITPPATTSVVQGQPAMFNVGAVGAPPLLYQWRLAGNNLPGQTNNSLTVPAAQASDAGDYVVVIANNSGSITSAVATLKVTSSTLAPSFLAPPSPFYSASIGASKSLIASVAGTPPLLFQWAFEGVAIPGATNVSLILENVQPENAGTYHLFVTNDYGWLSSSGSTLNVDTSGSGGTFNFVNFSFNRVLDVDGVSGLPNGNGYVAAVFVGTQSNALAMVGGTSGFVVPGRFYGGTRHVSAVAPGQTVFAQVRVWDSRVSATYEEARALGSKHGVSSVFQLLLGGGIMPPPSLNAMPEFALEAGTSVVGRRKVLSVSSARPRIAALSRSQQATSFVLTGTPGSTYAIEASTDLLNWSVLGYVVNTSGALKFSDPNPGATGRRFYRAKLVAP